jgi:hypothetical protein
MLDMQKSRTNLPPRAFGHMRLGLARSKGFPAGLPKHGYDLVAPLDAKSHCGADLRPQSGNDCRVRRFRAGERWNRYVIHKLGGVEHTRGRFDHDAVIGHEDGEAGYRFAAHAFRPGKYIPIGDAPKEMHTLRVTSACSLKREANAR